MQSSLRIIVTGLIAQHYQLGGITWHYLQYVIGLKRLGHDVYYLEDSGEYPYLLNGGASGKEWIATDCSENVNYLSMIMSRYDLENKWAYRFPVTSQWFGLQERRRMEIIQSADLLINVSGTLHIPESYDRIPHLVYIDTDPVVTQIKLAVGDVDIVRRVEFHDTHFSFGELFSENVPVTKQKWLPTRQPVVLSEWQTQKPRREVFTTIMSWTSYKPLTYSGKVYGQKDVEFISFLDLPREISPVILEVALNQLEHVEWQDQDPRLPSRISELMQDKWTPRELVTHAGWQVVDATKVCGDLDSYRHYIESSKAEWSVAKNVYVQGQSGWFSERSACYLAAGRPVVVQDTGFAGILPVGEGILPFKTLQDSVEAIREVENNYSKHSKVAREIAEEYFDSSKVLTRLIDEALNGKDR